MSIYEISLIKDSKRIWNAQILEEGNKKSPATLKWEWGTLNGKSDPQRKERIYEKGKAKRTPMEQALQDCKKMVKDKMRDGYVKHKGNMITDDSEDEELEIPFVMLAQKYADRTKEFEDDGGYIMPKLDGIFCMAHLPTGFLYSRQRIRIVGLEHIEKEVKKIYTDNKDLKGDWIVGELYKHGLGFQQITGLVRRTVNTSDDAIHSIEFHVFDAILPEVKFFERYAFISSLLTMSNSSGIIQLVPVVFVPCLKINVDDELKKWTSREYEGIMIHVVEGKGYQCDKRSKYLLKYKYFEQSEYRCISVNPGKHQKNIAGSVLLIDDVTGETFSATPKWKTPEKKELWSNRKEYVGKIATVEYFCKTEERGVPRFPILIGFRDPRDM